MRFRTSWRLFHSLHFITYHVGHFDLFLRWISLATATSRTGPTTRWRATKDATTSRSGVILCNNVAFESLGSYTIGRRNVDIFPTVCHSQDCLQSGGDSDLTRSSRHGKCFLSKLLRNQRPAFCKIRERIWIWIKHSFNLKSSGEFLGHILMTSLPAKHNVTIKSCPQRSYHSYAFVRVTVAIGHALIDVWMQSTKWCGESNRLKTTHSKRSAERLGCEYYLLKMSNLLKVIISIIIEYSLSFEVKSFHDRQHQ